MSIGGNLARARQDAGLTVTEVSKRTRIRETLIRTIERDDFALCGGDFYARGHIRSIGRVVGIDPEPLVQTYDDEHGGSPPAASSAVRAFEPNAPLPFPFRERSSPNWSAAMAVALAVVVLFGLFRLFSGDDADPAPASAQPDPVPPVQSPAVVPSPSPSASPPDEVTVRIKGKRASWLRARDAKGKQVFSGIVGVNDVKEWTVRKKIQIIIGNGGGIILIVNGKNIGAPGTGGKVVHLSFGPDDPA